MGVLPFLHSDCVRKRPSEFSYNTVIKAEICRSSIRKIFEYFLMCGARIHPFRTARVDPIILDSREMPVYFRSLAAALRLEIAGG